MKKMRDKPHFPVMMTKCSHCGKPMNEILIGTRAQYTETPDVVSGLKQEDGTVEMLICDECQKLIDDGAIPWRCGKCGSQGWLLKTAAIYEEVKAAAKRMYPDAPVVGFQSDDCPVCRGEM